MLEERRRKQEKEEWVEKDKIVPSLKTAYLFWSAWWVILGSNTFYCNLLQSENLNVVNRPLSPAALDGFQSAGHE